MTAALTKLSGSQVPGVSDRFCFCFWLFWAGFWPKLAPGPLSTGQARKMVQNAPKISPVDQLCYFVADSWSKPKTKKENSCLSDSKSSWAKGKDQNVRCQNPPGIRAGRAPEPSVSKEIWPSGPFPRTPPRGSRCKKKLQNRTKHN